MLANEAKKNSCVCFEKMERVASTRVADFTVIWKSRTESAINCGLIIAAHVWRFDFLHNVAAHTYHFT